MDSSITSINTIVIKIFKSEYSYPLHIFNVIGFVESLKRKGVLYSTIINVCNVSQKDFSKWRHTNDNNFNDNYISNKILQWLHKIFERHLPIGTIHNHLFFSFYSNLLLTI